MSVDVVGAAMDAEITGCSYRCDCRCACSCIYRIGDFNLVG
jgi:hypothetical protein